jgi:hypothetical protein
MVVLTLAHADRRDAEAEEAGIQIDELWLDISASDSVTRNTINSATPDDKRHAKADRR